MSKKFPYEYSNYNKPFIEKLFHGSNEQVNGLTQEDDGAYYFSSSKMLSENYGLRSINGSNISESSLTVDQYLITLEKACFFKTSTEYYNFKQTQSDLGKPDVFDELKKKGFDGIIVRNDVEEVIIFNPEKAVKIENELVLSIENKEENTNSKKKLKI